MPGSIRKRDELHDAPISPHKQMGRNLEATYLVEVGMGIPIETVRKQLLDLRPSESARWQADPVQYNEARDLTGRPRIPVRTSALLRGFYQARIRIDGE